MKKTMKKTTNNEIVDILIIHLNGENIIRNCLNSIYKNTSKKINFNIRLLLNNSKDNSEEIIGRKFPKVEIIKTKKTIGFAQASNILAMKSSGKYILFLNNDTEVEKNWLDELLTLIRKHDNCIAVQPKIKSLYDKSKFEYAGAAGGFIDKYGYPFCRGRIFGETEIDAGQYDNEVRIFWGCGVCLLVKRDDFIKLGMFDEDFFMYGEETDFCWRANIYGKEIWYCPKSTIYHIGSYSIDKEKKNGINIKKEYLLSRNHIIILLKNYSLKNLFKIMPIKLALEVISAIRFFPYKTLGVLLSIISLIFEYPLIFRKKRMIIQNNRKIKDNKIENLIYDKSIALEYFINGKNKFSKLKFYNVNKI